MHRCRRLCAAALVVCAVAACNGRRADRVVASPAAGPEASTVTLERTACFGSCPVYRVTMDGAGTVHFDGIAFVRSTGSDSAQVAPEHVQRIHDAAERLGFYMLADSYTMGDPTCKAYFTDAPSVIISLVEQGRSKRVAVDHGCTGFPAAVTELAELIDEVAGTSRWIID